MPEFQLYTKRDFSAYISDTIQFFKQFWKNFFQNYMIINGVLLLLLTLVYYFLFKDSFKNMFNPAATDSWFMYNNNGLLFGVSMLVFILVAIVFSVTSTAFPMVYLNLVDRAENETYSASEIFSSIKKCAGRIIVFGLISMVILVPLSMIVMAVGVLLSFVLIGIPLLIISVPFLMTWGMQSLYVYINEEIGYFDALGRGWKIIFSSFWNIIGSTIVMTMCIAIISSVFSMISVFSTLGSAFSTGAKPDAITMSPLMAAIYVFGMVLTYVLYNGLYVQQGLIYYSSLETTEHVQAYSDIDNIGKNEE
jgi:uncharacterized membrane protein